MLEVQHRICEVLLGQKMSAENHHVTEIEDKRWCVI
jgi:hypothetical protein